MPHEVIKRVGRRAYRYRVESYRDAETQKLRKRWTYLGVANADASADAAAAVSREPTDSRRRLLDAFERVAGRLSYASITAAAVSVEAGLAHGTFYRYFRDKNALFSAAVERIRDDVARLTPPFSPPYGSRESERERLRSWIGSVFEKPAAHPGVLYAYFERLESDAELRAASDARRAARVRSLAGYLAALVDARTIAPLRPVSVATALTALLEGAVRGAAVSRTGVDATMAEGVLAIVDGAIFGSGSDSVRARRASVKGVSSAVRTAATGGQSRPTRVRPSRR